MDNAYIKMCYWNETEWDVRNVKNVRDMFNNSPLEKNPPKWYFK